MKCIKYIKAFNTFKKRKGVQKQFKTAEELSEYVEKFTFTAVPIYGEIDPSELEKISGTNLFTGKMLFDGVKIVFYARAEVDEIFLLFLTNSMCLEREELTVELVGEHSV